MHRKELLLVIVIAVIVVIVLLFLKRRKRRHAHEHHDHHHRTVIPPVVLPPPTPCPCTPPPQPDPPAVTRYPGQGVGSCPTNEVVDINYTDQNIPSGLYILTGTGQLGGVSDYLVLGNGNPFSPFIGNLEMECTGTASHHRVQYLTSFVGVTQTTVVPPVSGSTITASWNSTTGVDQYLVAISGRNNGMNFWYGGFTTDTSLEVPVQSGMTNLRVSVFGFNHCNLSPASNDTLYLTSPP